MCLVAGRIGRKFNMLKCPCWEFVSHFSLIEKVYWMYGKQIKQTQFLGQFFAWKSSKWFFRIPIGLKMLLTHLYIFQDSQIRFHFWFVVSTAEAKLGKKCAHSLLQACELTRCLLFACSEMLLERFSWMEPVKSSQAWDLLWDTARSSYLWVSVFGRKISGNLEIRVFFENA